MELTEFGILVDVIAAGRGSSAVSIHPRAVRSYKIADGSLDAAKRSRVRGCGNSVIDIGSLFITFLTL